MSESVASVQEVATGKASTWRWSKASESPPEGFLRCSGCNRLWPPEAMGGYKTCSICRTRVKEYERAWIEDFQAYKIARGCDRCGYATCARSLDFHHRDPMTKDPRLNQHVDFMVRKWARGDPEIDDCDLLCRNCHGEIEDEIATAKRLRNGHSATDNVG